MAILSLIPFHVLAYYADTRFALKTGQVNPIFNYFYYFLDQWRLSLLFFISGYCATLYLNKYSPQKFIKDKVKRILLPLILGTVIFIPPQVYLEKVRFGVFQGSYLQFLPHIFEGIYPEGNSSWGHLWFLFYLFVYMFIYVVIWPKFQHWKCRFWYLLFPLGIEIFLRPYSPSFPNFITDYANILVFGSYFFYGAAFKQSGLEMQFSQYQKLIIIISVLLVIVTPFFYEHFLYDTFKSLRTISLMNLLPLLARKHLNFSNRFLEYYKPRNYPIYIVHHTAIIILAESLLTITPWIFFIVVSIGSLLISLLTVEMLGKMRIGRFILGMRLN